MVGYKQTDIGRIPVDWETKKLGTVGIFKKGKGIRKDEVESYGIPCVRYGELYTHHNEYVKTFNSYINSDTAKNSQFIQKNDILFAGSGETKEEIGKCAAIIDEIEAYAGGDVIILSPFDCNSLFLGFLLNSQTIARQKAKQAQGDAVVHIYPSNLSNIQIPLPPLPEQEAIAEVLSDTDALITALEKRIAKKRLIKQGAMQTLLTPKDDWEDLLLPQVVNYIHGKAHEQFIDENGQYIVVNSKFISTEGAVKKYSNKNYCSAKKGDVLTVLSDLPNGKALAKCYYVNENNKYAVNQRVCIWRSVNANSLFLYYVLNRNKYFLGLDDGVTQTHILNHHIEKCPIQIPKSIEEQTRIATILSDMDNEIDALEKKLSKTKELKQGLMQQLLTGKIRLV